MLYLLPTKANRKYSGKYPNAIHSISLGGTDRDGSKAIHFETNCGERYTCSYDRLDMPKCNDTRNFCGINFMVFVVNNTPITTMSQAEYDVWLASINAKRAIKA